MSDVWGKNLSILVDKGGSGILGSGDSMGKEKVLRVYGIVNSLMLVG